MSNYKTAFNFINDIDNTDEIKKIISKYTKSFIYNWKIVKNVNFVDCECDYQYYDDKNMFVGYIHLTLRVYKKSDKDFRIFSRSDRSYQICKKYDIKNRLENVINFWYNINERSVKYED